MELVQIPAAQQQQIALYDDSLSAWVLDESLPMDLVAPAGKSRL